MAAGIPVLLDSLFGPANALAVLLFDTSKSRDSNLIVSITPSAAITTPASFSVRDGIDATGPLIASQVMQLTTSAAIVKLGNDGSMILLVETPPNQLSLAAAVGNYRNELTEFLRVAVNALGVGISATIRVHGIPA